jgi:uncharacterized peroxidase-related enzyme
MTYLTTPDESPIYAADREKFGYVPNFTRVFALAPVAYAGWLELGAGIRDGMDLRRYELVTLAAARAVGSDYCAIAHALVLRDRYYSDDELRAIAVDHHAAGLDPVDVAVMDFAARVAADPTSVPDPAPLRAFGLSDVEVLHVVLAACARRFFSGVLSAVAALPDAYEALDPEVRAAITTTGPKSAAA